MASKFQRGYDDERFETIVNRNFHCLICFNVLREPVMCRRNEHYFCRGCITEHLRRNSHTCPTCADELSVETLCEVPRIVKDYLDELNIRCDYYDRGCRKLVQLQSLKYHIAECGFTPIICGNQGCGETISKRDRTYHENELCEFRKLKCNNCREIITKIAAMNTKMETMSTKVGGIDTRMKITLTKTVNTEKNLANVHMEMANMEGRIANIDGRIASSVTEIENMKLNMVEVKTKIENLDTRMVGLQESTEAKIEAVNNEVREMKITLTEVKDGFDHLKETVLEKIESKERNQEKMARDVSRTVSGGGKKQHIFVAGSYDRNSVEIFNYRQRLWSLLKPLPGRERWRASSFVYNNQVTVAGGFCFDIVDTMIQMNVQPIPDLTINWNVSAAKLPAKMCGHSSVLCKDSLFVIGGLNADQNVYSNCINELQLQPPYTVKLLSKMPEPRFDHSAVLHDDSILIFGGTKTGYFKDNLSSVLSYDLKKNTCQQFPPLPYPVSAMATVKWSENVVIIGGIDKDGEVFNKVIIYNIKTGKRYLLPSMLHNRKACMAVVIQNTIVVLGGEDERGNKLKSVEGFSFDRYAWEELPDMKEARSYATAVVI